ncbi:Uncharacterised protein [Bordetella pertussis]|nr:Uncharacterised protein [Bordetella pertussis]
MRGWTSPGISDALTGLRSSAERLATSSRNRSSGRSAMKTLQMTTNTLIITTARSRSTERTSARCRKSCRVSRLSATWTIIRPPLSL